MNIFAILTYCTVTCVDKNAFVVREFPVVFPLFKVKTLAFYKAPYFTVLYLLG